MKPARIIVIRELASSIARAPFSSGEPIRESKPIKSKGSGYLAGILPSGMRAISVAYHHDEMK